MIRQILYKHYILKLKKYFPFGRLAQITGELYYLTHVALSSNIHCINFSIDGAEATIPYYIFLWNFCSKCTLLILSTIDVVIYEKHIFSITSDTKLTLSIVRYLITTKFRYKVCLFRRVSITWISFVWLSIFEYGIQL